MRCLFSLLVCALVVSACQPRDSQKQADYAILIRDMGNPYWRTVYEGIQETAGDLGVSVFIQTLGTENDAEAQLNQCENALLSKPKALLFSAVNSVNLSPCLQKAYSNEILLVDLDGNINQQQAAAAGVEVAFSVASNNYELGKKAAEYVRSVTGKALVLEGHPGSEPGQQRKLGFHENIHSDINIVASIAADWDRLKAANITNDILQRHSDLSVVFAANDMMALGALESLRVAGRDDVIVIGVDGVSDALTAIKQGRLTATIAQLPYLIAKEGLTKAHLHVTAGAQYKFNQFVPVLTIDRDVLAESDEPLLEFLR